MTKQDVTQLAGWLVAPQPMLWTGKSDETLCLDAKRFEAVPDSFVDHMQTDHGEVQFIEAAFSRRPWALSEREDNGRHRSPTTPWEPARSGRKSPQMGSAGGRALEGGAPTTLVIAPD